MTEIYMFAVTASNSPIKMRTMEAFTNMEDLGKRIIRAFYEQKEGSWRYSDQLQSFVEVRYSFRVYRFEANSGTTGKLVSGKNLWRAMEREEGLKRDIIKSRLRGGSVVKHTRKILKIV